MRLRTALIGLATGVTVVLTACGNGPPPDSSSSGGGSGTDTGGGGGGAVSFVQSGTAAQSVTESDTLTFAPADVSVKVGDIVKFTNGGSATHNVTFADGTASGDMNGNDTVYAKFTKAGDYSYICTYHQPNMKGTVHVS